MKISTASGFQPATPSAVARTPEKASPDKYAPAGWEEVDGHSLTGLFYAGVGSGVGGATGLLAGYVLGGSNGGAMALGGLVGSCAGIALGWDYNSKY